MKYLWIGALVLAILLVFPLAEAQEIKIYTMPENITLDSSFLWVVEAPRDSVRVSWSYFGTPPTAGSFESVSDGKWACYFSAQDSTCGASPFASGTSHPGKIYVDGVNLAYEYRLTALDTKTEKEIKGNDVSAWITIINYANRLSVKYAIYSDKLERLSSGNAGYETATGRYAAKTKLNPGEYYLVFDVETDDGKKGGSVVFLKVGGTELKALDVDNLSGEETLDSGSDYRKTFNIVNSETDLISGLSVKVPASLVNVLNITLSDTSVAPGSSIYYVADIKNIETSMLINNWFELYSSAKGNESLIAKVPINLDLAVRPAATPLPTAEGPAISISPRTWNAGEVLEGQSISKTFKVKNSGTGELAVTSVSADGKLENKISSKKPDGIILGYDEELVVNITSVPDGKSVSTLTVESNGGKAYITVVAEGVLDVSGPLDVLKGDIEDTRTTYTGLGFTEAQMDTILSGAESFIQAAEGDIVTKEYSSALENYKLAVESHATAKAILGLKPVQPKGEFPLLLIVIIILIALAGLGGFLFFKKMKKGAERPTEEEYEEEGEL